MSPTASTGFRFKSPGAAWGYRVSTLSWGLWVAFVLWPQSRIPVLLALVIGTIANQVLFYRAARLGGTESPWMWFNGFATRAGRGCWNAAGERLSGNQPPPPRAGDLTASTPGASDSEPVRAATNRPSSVAATAFIGLAIFLLAVLGALALVTVAGHTVTTVNVADLPSGTPWQALYRADGSLGSPTANCPSLISWVGGERPAYCAGEASTEAEILVLIAVLSGGIAFGLRILIRRRPGPRRS